MAQTLSELLKQSTIDDHDEVIKACNTALKKSKSDSHARHVKTVALLKLDRFDDAIRVIDEGGDAFKQVAVLEWAYALYKTGHPQETVRIAGGLGANRGARHLEAQASYRAEDFARAAKIYDQLLADEAASAPEYNDLRINSDATIAQLQLAGSRVDRGKKIGHDDLEAFEITYNLACGAIAKGELNNARMLLKRAEALCNSLDELTPEDKLGEILPILVQRLYVAQRQNNQEEARQLSGQISVANIPELSTKRIAQNNLLLSSPPSNPYLLHKQFHEIPTPSDNDKLFSFQKQTMDINSSTIDLMAGKFGGIARSAEKVPSQQAVTSPEINALLAFNVAAHVKGKPSVKEALNLLKRRPRDVGLILTIVQLYSDAGKISAAVDALEAFLKPLGESASETDREVRFNTGLVSVLVALYTRQGRKTLIKSELAKAASYWQSKPDQPPSLLRAAGSTLLHSSNASELATAGDIFARLHETDPKDRFATSGYVASFASVSMDKVASEVDTLSSIQELTSGIDVDALESAGVPVLANPLQPPPSKKRPAETQERKKKRIKPSRMPKDFDPDKKLDPERWLPLRDRSTYRPRGKKGKQRAAERTQGGVVAEKEEATQPAAQKSAASAGKKKKSKGKK